MLDSIYPIFYPARMLTDDVLRVLARAGPSPADDVQRAVATSRSTLQRALAELKPRLVTAGRARATRYALRRPVDGVLTPVPVYELDPAGAIRHALTLHPVEPLGFYVEGHVPEVASGFHDTDPADPGPDPFADLPWFLLDIKPSGFLGRAWARAHADWPADPARWSGDDVLRFATHDGTDLPGAFVLGGFARDRLLARAVDRVHEADAIDAYPKLAERALAGPPVGSSAGGEHPKFTASVERDGVLRPCIVKFSPPVSTPGGERWADLLAAEHVAHAVLAEHGLPAAASRLVDAGGRRFLEVERFDRHGERGRSGVASLRSLDRAGVAADNRRWTLVTARLVREGRLTAADHERVAWLESFGLLLANTDMHPGNLSLRMLGTAIRGLAPVYDMLPMFYAPRHGGELPAGRFDPRSELDEFVPGTSDAAREFWGRVSERSDVSADFRALASAHATDAVARSRG
jgi:hypothetical protein